MPARAGYGLEERERNWCDGNLAKMRVVREVVDALTRLQLARSLKDLTTYGVLMREWYVVIFSLAVKLNVGYRR